MLVRDIDKRLDMRLVVRLRQNTELFAATANIEKPLPVFIYEEEDITYMSTYFPKQNRTKDLELLFRRFNAEDKEESCVITTRINNVKDLAIIRKLAELPSMTLNRADMSRGFLNISTRFHSSALDGVSRILSEYATDTQNSRVEWLGPSPGFIDIINFLNSEYPVSVITFEIDDGNSSANNLSGAENVLLEVKGSNSDISFDSILYSEPHGVNSLPSGVSEISKENGIYGYTFPNRFLQVVRDRSNKAHIIRMRFFVKPVSGKLQVTVFLPTNQVYEYYSILFDAEKSENSSIVVKYLLPYSGEIWNFV